MGTYDNSYSGNTSAVPGNPGVVPSPPTNNSSGVIPLTTGSESVTPLTINGTGNNTGGYSTITTIGSDSVVAPYITIPNYSDEIQDEMQKRDEKIEKQEKKIMELENKLSKLTSQVASILSGSKEVIDDNINTEKLKNLFEE